MIVKNIKFLRKHYGHNQSALGKILGVKQATISDYERKKTKIPSDKLKIIAQNYNVSVNDLVNKDLASEYDNPQVILTEDIEDLGNKIIRLRTSAIAKKSESFNRGMENYRYVLKSKTLDAFFSNICKLDLAITQFQKAWEEDKTYVALANSISTIFLIYSCYAPGSLTLGQILTKSKEISTVDLQRTMLREKSKTNPYQKQRRDTFNRYEDLVYKNIKLLKKNPKFTELGDYYSALCFLFGFTDEEIDDNTSYTIGIHMMLQLAMLDNNYATTFFE